MYSMDYINLYWRLRTYMWTPECLMNRVQIISKNTTLLSPLNITATRFIHSYPPSYFGNFTSAVWCAPQGPNPNISLSFSHLVLITGFIPGGYSRNDGSYREYVTNFNLHYSETLDKKTFQVRTWLSCSIGRVCYDHSSCAGARVQHFCWQPGPIGDVGKIISSVQTWYSSEQLCYCDRGCLHGHGHYWLSSLWRYIVTHKQELSSLATDDVSCIPI